MAIAMGRGYGVAQSVELVARAQHGDRDAFDALVGPAIDRLYALARLILRDADLAEDATQEAIVHCWRDLPGLRDPSRLDAWLRRLLVNAVADQFRRRRRFQATVTVLRPVDEGIDPTQGFADRDQVRRGFERLRLEHRTILVLHHYLGLTSNEAAQVLGIPEGTARSRLHYATEAMRAALEADAREPSLGEVSA
jgi:RNA polymerase sigma-70 factor (ECF subfamily)